MDVQQIIAEFGAYYLKSGQNSKRVKQLLLQAAVTPGYMTPIKTDETVYQMATSTITSILQGFQKGWTPKGAVKFLPNPIPLRKFKIDFEEYPDDLEATWLGFLASNSTNRKEWPFVKWLIETHIIPKAKEEAELSEYYNGVYAAPTPGTASDAGTNLDGLKKLIQAAVDSDGTTRGIANVLDAAKVGALDTATIFDQVEAAVDGIAGAYQTKKMGMFMAPEMARAYLRDKRSQGFYTISSQSGINTGIDFTPQQVVGLPSMAGTTDLFITPKENMIYATKKAANATNFKLEESKRQVFVMADWWEGIGFGINEAIWTNIPKTV